MTPRLQQLALALARAHEAFVSRLRDTHAALDDLDENASWGRREEHAAALLRLLDESRSVLLRAHAQLVGAYAKGPEGSARVASLSSHVNALVDPLFAHPGVRGDGKRDEGEEP